jgi:hypothetical protein
MSIGWRSGHCLSRDLPRGFNQQATRRMRRCPLSRTGALARTGRNGRQAAVTWVGPEADWRLCAIEMSQRTFMQLRKYGLERETTRPFRIGWPAMAARPRRLPEAPISRGAGSRQLGDRPAAVRRRQPMFSLMALRRDSIESVDSLT